jgi:hypothetical protein
MRLIYFNVSYIHTDVGQSPISISSKKFAGDGDIIEKTTYSTEETEKELLNITPTVQTDRSNKKFSVANKMRNETIQNETVEVSIT